LRQREIFCLSVGTTDQSPHRQAVPPAHMIRAQARAGHPASAWRRRAMRITPDRSARNILL
jgi:hypothetical protein